MITSLCFDTKYPLPRDEVFSNCFVSLRNLVYLVRRLRRSPLKGLASLDEAILKESLGLVKRSEPGGLVKRSEPGGLVKRSEPGGLAPHPQSKGLRMLRFSPHLVFLLWAKTQQPPSL
jgi:hypothetical protein